NLVKPAREYRNLLRVTGRVLKGVGEVAALNLHPEATLLSRHKATRRGNEVRGRVVAHNGVVREPALTRQTDRTANRRREVERVGLTEDLLARVGNIVPGSRRRKGVLVPVDSHRDIENVPGGASEVLNNRVVVTK